MSDDKKSVFIYGVQLPDAELPPLRDDKIERRPFTDDDNTSKLLQVCQPLGNMVSANVQYDTEIKTAGIRVVFEKSSAAKDCAKALNGQKFFHFRLHVLSSFDYKDEEEKASAAARDEAAMAKNPLLPDNHLLPEQLRFNTELAMRLFERITNAATDGAPPSALFSLVQELKPLQAEMISLATRIQECKEGGGQKRQCDDGALAVDQLSTVLTSATTASEAIKRCVYFPSVALSVSASAPSTNCLVGAVLSSMAVEHKLIIRRWSLATSPFANGQQQQQQHPQQSSAALIVELQSEQAATAFVAKFSGGGANAPAMRVERPSSAVTPPVPDEWAGAAFVELRPLLASTAVQRRWLAQDGVFPLPAADVAALFGSRETSDTVRDLKSALQL